MMSRHLPSHSPPKRFVMEELALTAAGSGVWTAPAPGTYRLEVIAGGGKGGNGSGRTSYQARTYDDGYCSIYASQFGDNWPAAWASCVSQYTTHYNAGRGGSAGGAGQYRTAEIYLRKGETVAYTVGGSGQNSSFGEVTATAGTAGAGGSMGNRTGGTGGYANNARRYGKGGNGGTGEAQGGGGRTNGAAGGAGAVIINYLGR